jgi:hypothetical protein
VTIETVPVVELVLDYSLYPRTALDDRHASRLAEAVKAGETLPPVVADHRSKRVSDGFHRCKAHLLVNGDTAVTQVEWREYADDAELFKDATRLNARHGLRISRFDEAHCMAVAMRLGVGESDLAEILALTQTKYEELRAARFATAASGEAVLLKRSNRHLAGSTITKKQAAGNARSSGWRLAFHIDQVINAIQSDLLEHDDLKTVAKLRKLSELLDKVLDKTQ